MANMVDTMELNFFKLFFNATNWTNIADNAVTAPVTQWYPSLHTAAQSDSSTTQNSSEAAYTGYAGVNRPNVVRSSSGWTCATAAGVTTAKNAALVTYGIATGAVPETETHTIIGSAITGAGTAYLWGALTQSLVVNLNVTPQWAVGDLSCEAK